MSDLIIMSGVVLFIGGGLSVMQSIQFRAHSRAWHIFGFGKWVALAGAVLMLTGAVAKVISHL